MRLVFTVVGRGLLMLSRWLYGFKVQGAHYIPAKGSYLIVMNHVGFVADVLTLWFLYLHRRGQTFYGYADFGFRSGEGGVLGRLFRRAGIVVIRGVKGPGMSTGALFKALRILKGGYPIIVPAEGEMSWDGRLQPLQGGAAWMALRSGVPVVPVVSKGGYEIMPRWSKWPRLRGKMSILVGKPFQVRPQEENSITRQDIDRASREIWNQMATLLGESPFALISQVGSSILESQQQERESGCVEGRAL